MYFLRLLPAACLLSGCAAALPALPALTGLMSTSSNIPILTNSTVVLNQSNYRVIKTNVIGHDSGFSLLGLITIISPEYTVAFGELYHQLPYFEGKAQALINLLPEHSTNYFLLFSLPKISIRADVIEFIEKPNTFEQNKNQLIQNW